ncbi:MAG: tetratricopeptide repeat protein [Hydrogenophaga sp.]|nr:tetratricopeptide repeat protein [Hydrogenophaga sp.]
MNASFDQAKFHFIEGVQLFEAGRLAEAETHFLASLALLPGRVSTLSNLGATRLALGRPLEALTVLDEALAQAPDDLGALGHRGVALAALQRHAQALASFDAVLAIEPDNAAACHGRAGSLDALGRPEDALAAIERLLVLQPGHADGWARRGQLLQRLRRGEDEALASYDRAVALAPELGEAWSQRGSLLKDLGRREEAADAFRQALAHGADPELNRFFLASLTGGQDAPDTAPVHYVQSLFDDYADEFDQHLVGVLNYSAHRTLAAPLQALRSDGRYRSALDLGCGTGLCGPQVRPFTDRLAGVDLAPRMLEKARTRGVYDELVAGDVVEHLRHTPQRHDLVLSADVFIYIGDLAPVFDGVARVMEPGGVFCFSAEQADDALDFELTSGMRYAHSQRHLRALAARFGFEVVQLFSQAFREDQRQPIPGLFVYLVRT